MNEEIWQKEWRKLCQDEREFVEKNSKKKQNKVTEKLEEQIPEKVAQSLRSAFGKAFEFILKNGTSVIEKTYSKEEYLQNYQIDEYALELKQTKKSAKTFSKKAKASSGRNIAISGVKGAGFGVFGVGMPDIPLFVSMILKSAYEISLHYGYDYQKEEEEFFLLNVLSCSVAYGEECVRLNEENNRFMEESIIPTHYDRSRQVEVLSDALASEVLCMKFLQGVPVVGVVGGAYDVVIMKKMLHYVKMKYHRRFVQGKLKVALEQEQGARDDFFWEDD